LSLTIFVRDIINQSTSELLGKHISWERVELGAIAEVLNGYAFSSERFSKEKGLPLIRIRDISRNSTETRFDGPFDEVYLVKPDDLLVGMDGDFNCALWKGPIGLLNQRVCKVEVYQELFDLKFLFYVLPGYLKAINDATSSMTVKHLSSKSIEEIPLPLAPLAEQHRIVAAIEQQFTRLDNAVASLQSAKRRVKQYRTSLLKSAVAGELTKEWRAEHPADETGAQLLARILAERRARWEEEQEAKMREKGIAPKDNKWRQAYKEPQGPDVEKLPVLPEGWCWATVEQLADVIGGVTKGRNLAGRITTTLPYLRVANVQRGFLDLGVIKTIEILEDEIEKYLLRSGDVLLTEGGDADKLGRATVWKGEVDRCIHQNHVFRARFVELNMPPSWLMFYANSEQGRNYFLEAAKQTVNLASINLTQLRNCPIPLPPLAEQEQIVAEVEARLSNIAQLEEAIEANLKRAEHERQSILQEAFAGRLVPQDPTDEPASVLLEHIREERRKREEAEKVVKSSRKGVAMEIAKRRRVRKAGAGQQELGLYDTLVEAGQPLPPDELFKRVGLKADDQPESVEVFYEELHAAIENKLIKDPWLDNEHVLLEALEPSTEIQAQLAEEEPATQPKNTEQSKKTVEQTRLWDI